MVNISGISNKSQTIAPVKNQEKSDGMFQKALDNVMATKAPQMQKTNMQLGEIRTTNISPVNMSSFDVAQKSDKVLSMLENYSNDLLNPLKSLKDLEPQIKKLKENTEELMEGVMSSNEDGTLRQHAAQCAMLASLEVMKFERGDYV